MSISRERVMEIRGKVTVYVPTAEDTRRCCFCNSCEDDELELGKFYQYNGIVTHYYCLLLSSNMQQRGRDDEGILGFLTEDINKELRRGKRLNCSYCRKTGATLGCCNTKCKRIFHLPCGLRAGSLHQFFGEFRSYCTKHRPLQQVENSVLSNCQSLDSTICYICYEATNPRDLRATLWAPCCKKNAWFHRGCVQRLAMSAGYFFKCPLCNNKNDFQKAMLDHGIFIPSQDASWELVPNAFEELLYRHNRCDAEKCLCPKGREHTSTNARWELTLCRTCGSQGIHMACGKLKWVEPVWDCAECVTILQGSNKTNLEPSEISKSRRFRKNGRINQEISSDDDENGSSGSEDEETRSRDSDGTETSGIDGNSREFTEKNERNELNFGIVEKLTNCEDEDCELDVCESADGQSEDETRHFVEKNRLNRGRELEIEKNVAKFVGASKNADIDDRRVFHDKDDDLEVCPSIQSQSQSGGQDNTLENGLNRSVVELDVRKSVEKFVTDEKNGNFENRDILYERNDSTIKNSFESVEEIRILHGESKKIESTNGMTKKNENFDKNDENLSNFCDNSTLRNQSEVMTTKTTCSVEKLTQNCRIEAHRLPNVGKAANIIDKTQKLNEICDLEVWDSIKHLSEERKYKIDDKIEKVEEAEAKNAKKGGNFIEKPLKNAAELNDSDDCQLIYSAGFPSGLTITPATFLSRLKPGPCSFKLQQFEKLRKNIQIRENNENSNVERISNENPRNTIRNENPGPLSKKPRVESQFPSCKNSQTNFPFFESVESDDEVVVLSLAHGNLGRIPKNSVETRETREFTKSSEKTLQNNSTISKNSSANEKRQINTQKIVGTIEAQINNESQETRRDFVKESSSFSDEIEILETINGNSKFSQLQKTQQSSDMNIKITNVTSLAPEAFAEDAASKNSTENVKNHEKLEIVRFELPAPIPGSTMTPIIYGLTLPGTNHTVPLIISTLPTENIFSSSKPPIFQPENYVPKPNSTHSVVFTPDGRVYGQSTTVDGQNYVFPAVPVNPEEKPTKIEQRNPIVQRIDKIIHENATICSQTNSNISQNTSKIIDTNSGIYPARNSNSLDGKQHLTNLLNVETTEKSKIQSKTWTVPLKGIFNGIHSEIRTGSSKKSCKSNKTVRNGGENASFDKEKSVESNSAEKIKSAIDSRSNFIDSSVNSSNNSSQNFSNTTKSSGNVNSSPSINSSPKFVKNSNSASKSLKNSKSTNKSPKNTSSDVHSFVTINSNLDTIGIMNSQVSNVATNQSNLNSIEKNHLERLNSLKFVNSDLNPVSLINSEANQTGFNNSTSFPVQITSKSSANEINSRNSNEFSFPVNSNANPISLANSSSNSISEIKSRINLTSFARELNEKASKTQEKSVKEKAKSIEETNSKNPKNSSKVSPEKIENNQRLDFGNSSKVSREILEKNQRLDIENHSEIVANLSTRSKTKDLRLKENAKRNSNVNFMVKIGAESTNFVTEVNATFLKRIESESSDATNTDEEIYAENPTSSQHKMRLLNGVESSSYVPISELNESSASKGNDAILPAQGIDDSSLPAHPEIDSLAEIRTRKRHQSLIDESANKMRQISDRNWGLRNERMQRISGSSDGDAGSRFRRASTAASAATETAQSSPTSKYPRNSKQRRGGRGSRNLDANGSNETKSELSNSRTKRKSTSNETIEDNIDSRVAINSTEAATNHNCTPDRIGLINSCPKLRDLKFRVCGTNFVQMTLYETYTVNISTNNERIKSERDFRDSQVFSYDDKLNMSSERAKRLSRRRSCKENYFVVEKSENVSLDVAAKRSSTENNEKGEILDDDKAEKSLRSNATKNSIEINGKNGLINDDEESGSRDELKENLDPIPTTTDSFYEKKTKVRRKNEGNEHFLKLETIGEEIDGDSRRNCRNIEGNINITRAETIPDEICDNSLNNRRKIDDVEHIDKQNASYNRETLTKLRKFRRKKEGNYNFGTQEAISDEIDSNSMKNFQKIDENSSFSKEKTIGNEFDADSRQVCRKIDENECLEKHETSISNEIHANLEKNHRKREENGNSQKRKSISNEIDANNGKYRRKIYENECLEKQEAICSEIDANFVKNRRKSEENGNLGNQEAICNEIDANFMKNRRKSEKNENCENKKSVSNEITEISDESLSKKRVRRSSATSLNNLTYFSSDSMEFPERRLKKRRISMESEKHGKKMNWNDSRLKNDDCDDDITKNIVNHRINHRNLKIFRKNWHKRKNDDFSRKMIKNDDNNIDSQPSFRVSLDLTRIRQVFIKNPPKKSKILKNSFFDKIGVNFDENSTKSSLKFISKRSRSLNDLSLPQNPLISKDRREKPRKSISFENLNLNFPAKNISFNFDANFL